jgi:CSLREA domain-containing protein
MSVTMPRHPFFGILLAIVVCMAATPATTFATAITVTATTDELNANGNCSLREAIQAANTNAAVDACAAGQSDQVDTITVPAGTYTLMIAGSDGNGSATVGDLDLMDDVTITGAGAATTIIQACDVEQQATACPAGHGIADRVFDVIDCDATISGVTVRRGRAGTQPGHGIFVRQFSSNATASLTLTDAVVTKNGTTDPNAVGRYGGGIAVQSATATLTRATVSDNVLGILGTNGIGGGGGNGGGIGILGGQGGGANPASLVMTDCTVSGNVAGSFGGGVHDDHGSAILTNTTISGNHAGASGGGFGNSSGTGTLTNCTISGNQAEGNFGGGVFLTGGAFDIRSCTITLNHLGTGQGAGGLEAVSTGAAVLRNTIIAGNTHDNAGPDHSPDCQEFSQNAIVSEGHNFLGEALHCASLVGVGGDQIGTQAALLDAKLGPLADNGGPTLTHLPLPDSLALDAADPATPGSGGTSCPTTDQRGDPRPSGIACDIGAVEVDAGGGGPIAVHSVQPAVGGNAGTAYTRVLGAGFALGAVVKLVRTGFPDVVGATADVRASAIVSILDLAGVTPGVWSVRVENPDQSGATLTDAYTVQAGGGADLWSSLVVPRGFYLGRSNTIYLQFGNRGLNDARAVPLWLSFPDELEWHVPFPVSAPPAQPGQVATDWTHIAIDVPIPPPANRDSFPFLVPIIPAGTTRTLRMRVKSPNNAIDPSRSPFRVSADLGTPYLQPAISPAIVAGYVARAKEYATTAYGTTPVQSDAAIDQYVRTQLAKVVAEGTLDTLGNLSGDPTIYSQAQLVIDTGQFIAGESATAAASRDVSWLARVVSDLVGGVAEARYIDPDCDPQDTTCERVHDTCADDPTICTDAPVGPCDHLNKVDGEYIFTPCNPQNNGDVPFLNSHDPNDKIGPGGQQGFIDGVTPLPYTVLFENESTASGDALEVTVTDQLDTSKYDLDTFRLGPISFGTTFVPVPPDVQAYTTEVDLRPDKTILVGIDAKLDKSTGVVTWKFTTLDPATHEFPENPDEGFLPPNVTQPEGEGAVLFTVSLKPGFALGTTVCNQARLVFDFNAPIDTPEFCNTVGQPEDCENCIDDDGDGMVDRADSDCAAAANGAGAGVGADAAKALDKCAKAIRKAGDKITSTHLKQLGACQKAVADCVQLKPGDAACLAKATAKCTKARGGLPGADAKLTAAITKACAEPAVIVPHLLDATGLGFEHEVEACGERGLGDVATLADVAECVTRQHVCAAARLLGAAVPRARELLVLGGFDPATDLGCFATGANGGGTAIAPEKRKPLRKCDGAIQKAASKLQSGRAKAAEACGAAVFTCVQTKPGDASCVTKAGGTCTKALAALPKLTSGFAATIAKACGAPLAPADLLAPEGLGASALADTCARFGVASLATVADVSTCLERKIACDVDQQIQSATPRLGELLDLGGVTLP